MPRDNDLDILAQARIEFNIADQAEREIRAEYSKCMDFIALKQWNPAIVTGRGDRPSLVIDHLGPICDQIINDWRRNRIGIQIGPADSVANEKTAKVITGMIRNIEYLSRAQIAYDSAFEQMVRGNRGYVGVITKRRPGTFKQDILIRRFPDATAVYLDPYYKEADQSDMNYAFVRDVMAQSDFKKRFPKASETDFADWGADYADWVKTDSVVIAEYWKAVERIRKLWKLTHAIPVTRGKSIITTDEVFEDEVPKLPDGVTIATNPEDGGREMIEDEPVREITQRLITGREILSETKWVGYCIPIAPFWGKEMWVAGVKKLFSAISRGLDAQMELNYAESSIAEELGDTVRTPYVGYLGQFKTQRQQWQTANVVRYAFLEVDPLMVGDKLAPLPVRGDHEPEIVALTIAADRAANNIRMTTGMNKSALGIDDSKVKSGVAINALKSEGDNATYDFPQNGARGVEMIGNICVDLVPKIYSGEEIAQILNEQEEQESVLINGKPGENAPVGQQDAHFLDQGKYKVRVSAAPSHQSMREEGAAFLQQLFTELPEPQKVMIAAPMVRSQQFSGKDEIADRLELPEYKKQNGKQIPPEAQAVIEQGQQLIAAANQHIALLERERDAKMLELATQKEIATGKDQTSIAVAEINAEAKREIEGFRAEIATIKHTLDVMMSQAQMESAELRAGQDREHAAQMQDSSQVHEASQAQAAQAATAGQQ